MSLEEFADSGLSVQIAVPWWPETLWWVARDEDLQRLQREGIARGRIWTARELQDLASIPCLRDADIEGIGRLKSAFGARIASVLQEGSARPSGVTLCPVCRANRFWRSIHGAIVCGNCHPPASRNLVACWMDDTDSSDGAP